MARLSLSWIFGLVSLSGLAMADENFAVVADAIPEPLTKVVASAERGREIFVRRDGGHCVLCHQVAGLTAAFQGNVGPDLSGIGNRYDAGQLRLRIVDASKLNPQTIMPPYYRTRGLHRVAARYQNTTALSAEQIEHLVAYLAQLRSSDS